MSIRILYFAGLKEKLGRSGQTVDLPAGVVTVRALRDWLVGQGGEALASVKNLRCAVNQNMATLDAAVRDGDEVAFFPPVTGG